MDDKASEMTYVKISRDEMEAYLYLTAPEDEERVYTIKEVLDILAVNGVTEGILQENLKRIVAEKIIEREIKIAEGTMPVNGKDGYYEYWFNTDPPDKPVIREDGSVDYWSVFAVQTVSTGDVIAKYIPPTAGTPGMTVTGKELEAKRGKELLPLKGKGFVCGEDNQTYTALEDGKIEFKNKRIVITNMLELFQDVDFNNGRIDFKGDVVIHGSVGSGSHITSGGSVTIDGNVEATVIEAKKDVILRNGMQGGGRASIKAGGNLFAKFIEGTAVEVGGSIQADVLMNSQVHAGDTIEISGRKAVIIGGRTTAGRRIEVVTAGNPAEVKTFLGVGVDEAVSTRAKKLKTGVKQIGELLEKIDVQLADINLRKNTGLQFARDKAKEKATELLRYKIKCMSDRAEFEKELKELGEKMELSKQAGIAVSKYTYPGVTIKVGAVSMIIEQKQLSMEYRYEGGEIAMHDIYTEGVS